MLKLKSVNFKQQEFQSHCLKQTYSGQTAWLIGRNTNCDLILPSPEVSRVHGRIFYNGGFYYFVDVGSSSGSLLNGELVLVHDQRQLCTGDLLQIGETLLFVEELLPLAPLTPQDTSQTASMPVWTGEDLLCRCCHIVEETPTVKTFWFVAEPAIQFAYSPGQFVNLQVEINGQKVIRPYTLSSSPTRPAAISITVKRENRPPDQPNTPPGLVSNWLHDHLKEGDRIQFIGGPLGNFTCVPEVPAKLLLISAGSGITPMMSMSRWLQDSFSKSNIIFFHSARTPEDIIFQDELQLIAAQMPNFRLVVTTTQTGQGYPWMGFIGRISQPMLQLIVPDLSERSVFVCGPEGFLQQTKSILRTMNLPKKNYREETFGGKKQLSSPQFSLMTEKHALESTLTVRHQRNGDSAGSSSEDTTQAVVVKEAIAQSTKHTIHFCKSKQRASVEENLTILEIAEQNAVQLNSSCRVGACGVCKVRIKGQVRYANPPAALTETEHQMGYALACVGYPLQHLEVEA